MGFGGALIWTGLAYNLKQKWPEKKIVFLYERSLRDFILRRPHSDHSVYRHNKDIDCICDRITWRFKKTGSAVTIFRYGQSCVFLLRERYQRAHFYKTGKHAIQIACDVHNISNARLQPRIWLSEREIASAARWGKDAFFTWFDNAENTDVAFLRGQ